jgi:hypothetical protein
MIDQTWMLTHPYGDQNSITIKIVNFINVNMYLLTCIKHIFSFYKY